MSLNYVLQHKTQKKQQWCCKIKRTPHLLLLQITARRIAKQLSKFKKVAQYYSATSLSLRTSTSTSIELNAAVGILAFENFYFAGQKKCNNRTTLS
jgi:hypothetical protein